MAADPHDRSARAASGRWHDWANLVLGIWLFISPWVLNFAAASAPGAGNPETPGTALANAAWNAWVLGVIIALVSISALSRPAVWQEWLNALLGIWVFIAPWVLGFAAAANAAWDHWIVGFLVFIAALAGLSALRGGAATAADLAHAGDKPIDPLNRPPGMP